LQREREGETERQSETKTKINKMARDELIYVFVFFLRKRTDKAMHTKVEGKGQ